MIAQSIQHFLSLIRGASHSNSYKMAWAKAIVEICHSNPKTQFIELKEIAQKMYKYYWNQTIYFDLIQSNNPNKRPEFLQIVRAEIDQYYQKEGERQPKHFERIEDAISIKLNKLVRILKKDVSWRFLNLGKEVKPLYKYEKGSDFLEIHHAQDIAHFASILHEAINFKWTQLLENYNTAPRIAKKLQVLDFPEIKRKSLSPFKPFLDAHNADRICFICHQPIFDGQLSIDHVIPWSFIFSDDLWNLVYAHRSCNSSKSNRILEEKTIIRLEQRNEGLLSHLLNDEELSKKKHTKELEMAVEKDYVRKFWINCKS